MIYTHHGSPWILDLTRAEGGLVELDAIASRLEAIATREAIAIRLEASEARHLSRRGGQALACKRTS